MKKHFQFELMAGIAMVCVTLIVVAGVGVAGVIDAMEPTQRHELGAWLNRGGAVVVVVVVLGVGALALSLLWQAIMRGYDAVYDRWRDWQDDNLELHRATQAADLSNVKRMMPDYHGRQGVAWDGATFRDLDSKASFTMREQLYLDPVLEKLNAIQKAITARAGEAVPQTYHYENVIGDNLAPGAPDAPELGIGVAWRNVTLSDLQGRYGRGTYHRLLLGETVTNGTYAPVVADMTDMIHVLTSGGTGWGKSTFLEAIAKQLVSSGDCDLAFVDLGVNTFGALAGYGLYPIADTPGLVVALFQALCQEMESRRAKMGSYPQAKTLAQYNHVAGDALRPLVVLVDEASVLFDRSGDACGLATDLTRMGRKYGVGCVLGGTDFRAETLPTSARGNCGARIAFHFDEPSLSRSIIRSTEAVNLRDRGRALALLPGRVLTEVQCPIVSTWDDLPARQDQIELSSVEVLPRGNATPDQVARVVALKAAGKSDTAIARELWHGTSHYIDQVREILRQQQQGGGPGIAVDVLSDVVVAEGAGNE